MSSTKPVLCWIVVAAVLGVAKPAIGQELLELARAQATRYPGLPVEIPSSPGHYDEPKTVEQLTKEAVAVVEATVSRMRSYVGGSRGDRVLTDYSLTASNVIAGRLPVSVQRVPSPGTSPILTVYGGEVVLEGVTVRCTDVNRAAITDGTRYLLFLRDSRQAGTGRYEIHYGGIFEVSQDQLKPLLKKANDVFPEFIDRRPTDVVARIQKAAQAR